MIVLAGVLVIVAIVALALHNIRVAQSSLLTSSTPTPTPTRTITPSAEPSPEPGATTSADFEPVTISSDGSQRVVLPATSGVVRMEAGQSSSLIVNVVDDQGMPTGDLLVNAEGGYQGTTVYGLASDDGVALQINAQGPWKLTVEPVSSLPELMMPAQGHGDAAFRYTGPAAWLSYSHPGEGLFVLSDYGLSDPVVVNELGAATGDFSISAGTHLVVIRAEGEWQLAGR